MKCLNCKKEIKVGNKRWKKYNKFCSGSCSKKYAWKSGKYDSDDYRNKISIAAKKWIKMLGHPRGMLGKKQSLKAILTSSKMCKERVGEKHPMWVGGTQPYWNKIARKVMSSDKKECFYCHKKSILVIHHKDEDISNNHKSNLQIVCKSCHRKICHKDVTMRVIKQMNEAKLKNKEVVGYD